MSKEQKLFELAIMVASRKDENTFDIANIAGGITPARSVRILQKGGLLIAYNKTQYVFRIMQFSSRLVDMCDEEISRGYISEYFEYWSDLSIEQKKAASEYSATFKGYNTKELMRIAEADWAAQEDELRKLTDEARSGSKAARTRLTKIENRAFEYEIL